MKTKILFIALVAFVLFGCKTTKEATKTTAEVKTNADLSVKQLNAASLDVSANFSKDERNFGKEVKSDNSTVNETIEELTTNTKFSKPDSTGAQYPESTTTTKKTTRRGEQKNLNTNTESKTQAETKAQASDKSDYKSEGTQKDKGKKAETVNALSQLETKTETPGFITAIALVAGLLGVALIFYLLKRFGVIK